ncbi:MAG TPA: PDR/VanB family oxidoreductase [Allosphingosinicella sp.]
MASAALLTVQVSEVSAEARDVVRLELRPVSGGALPPFEPGSHIEVTLPNGLVRHYSMVNDCRETDRYVIAVGRAAAGKGGSDYIHRQVRCGSQLRITPPRNNFHLDPKAGSYLFLAGGIGVTPIMAMIRWAEANKRPWRLVYAARSRQRTAFYEELCGFGPERVHFHFDDERGCVLDVAEAMAGLAPDEQIYCCGPAPLMKAAEEAAKNLPPGTNRFEWFDAPEDAAADAKGEEFRIRLNRSGRELTVPADKSILETLEANGIIHPFSCREGLCGTCQTGVCEGEPDHRDYVLSDEERAVGDKMMVCVSRAKSPLLVLDL